MAQVVIRNTEDDVKARLKQRAAQHGWSMEEKVRHILSKAVGTKAAARKTGLHDGYVLGAGGQLSAYGWRGARVHVQGNHHVGCTPRTSALSCSISSRMTDLAINNGSRFDSMQPYGMEQL